MKSLAFALVLAAWGCASTKPDHDPVFYPPPPAEPRIQFLDTFTRARDIEGRSAFRDFVVGEQKEGVVIRAHGIAWHANRLYVCDPGLPHVVIFDFTTKVMRLLDPKRPAMFKKCIEIAVAPDGWKYITDTGHRKVIVYDAEDRYRMSFGDPEGWKPVGIAATRKKLYVTDVANHQLVVLDRKTGKEENRFGAQGGAEDQFYYPLSIRVGPKGDLYVTDSFNFRIKRLKPDGSLIRTYGQVGRTPGSFSRPRGVALDREGRIYAADAAFENVQIFDKDGKLLLFFGETGGAPGALNLPASVLISYEAVKAFEDRVAPGQSIEYVVFVTSQTGPNKVNAYGLLKQR